MTKALTAKNEVERRVAALAAPDEGEWKVGGYAIKWNVRARLWGDFYEVFTVNSIEADKRVDFLINHAGLPIASTESRSLDISSDGTGLAYEAKFDPEDPDAKRLMPKIRRGDVNGVSIGFISIDEEMRKENGQRIRVITRAKLVEMSATHMPAYPQTSLAERMAGIIVRPNEHRLNTAALKERD